MYTESPDEYKAIVRWYTYRTWDNEEKIQYWWLTLDWQVAFKDENTGWVSDDLRQTFITFNNKDFCLDDVCEDDSYVIVC